LHGSLILGNDEPMVDSRIFFSFADARQNCIPGYGVDGVDNDGNRMPSQNWGKGKKTMGRGFG
jgi:hypothetical protein